jgi:hypothetical protein
MSQTDRNSQKPVASISGSGKKIKGGEKSPPLIKF